MKRPVVRPPATGGRPPTELLTGGIGGVLVLIVTSIATLFAFQLLGLYGLIALGAGAVALVLTGYLLIRQPVGIAIIWFLTMSGLHTLVMVRMPGLPDFSFPRMFLTIILIMMPLGAIRGRDLVRPPLVPDLLIFMYTLYVLINLYTLGSGLRFSTWMASSFAPMAGYFFAKQYIDTEKQLKYFSWALILASTYFWIVSIGDHFAIEQMVWPKSILDRNLGNSWYGRSRGPFLQPALFGQIIGAYMLVHLFVLARKVNLFAKVYVAANFALSAVGLLYTYTRGGWLATMVGIAFLTVLRPAFRKMFIIACLVGLVIMATGFLSAGDDEFLSERVGDEDTVRSRLAGLSTAVRMINDRPLFGVGYFQYTERRHNYNRGTDVPFYGFIKRKEGQESSIHDIYIGRAAEEGLVGLFLFLGFYAAVALQFLRRWRENPKGDWWNRDTLALFAAMIVTYMVGGMIIDFRYFDLVNILPCFLAGIIVGFPRLSDTPAVD